MILYRQCELRRQNVTTVSWLPEKFARQGLTLRLRDDAGQWTTGWLVERAFAHCVPGDRLDHHKAVRQHRKRSGDAVTRPK